MSDKEHGDLKEDASLSLRANAADLASMLAIGEHITELTRVTDRPNQATRGRSLPYVQNTESETDT